MINKIANFDKWKKWLFLVVVVFSFALLKSDNTIALNSANGIFVSLLMILGFGIFYWLIFEVLAGFFYSALKPKIEKQITYAQFLNIFRLFIIFFNILLYFFQKIIILINFYSNFLILLINLILLLIYFIILFFVLKKYFLKNIDEKLNLTYFSFAFMYMFLHTIMWGVL